MKILRPGGLLRWSCMPRATGMLINLTEMMTSLCTEDRRLEWACLLLLKMVFIKFCLMCALKNYCLL